MAVAVNVYDRAMSRWKPNARGRLEQAAFDLFLKRGYDQTTVADIAKRAGLTERTFFRHYADKREVLFGDASALRAELVRALGAVSPELSAIEAVRITLETVSTRMRGRLSLARERRRIIAAHPDLQERDVNKRSTLTDALEAGLQQRGVPNSAASLAAEMGIAVFYNSFSRWLDHPADRELVQVVHDQFDELKAVAAGTESRNADH